MKFSICLSILIQTETFIVLNNIVIILLDTPMIRGSLAQYFYSMNGRVQFHGQMNEKAKLQKHFCQPFISSFGGKVTMLSVTSVKRDKRPFLNVKK